MKIKEVTSYTLYDSETTGLDLTEARIVEHGCLRIRDNKIVDSYRTLVNQKMEVPYGASEINGITTEMCEKEGIDPKLACEQVINFLGDDIVAGLNNVAYDFPLLEKECNRYGLPRPKIENWLDVGTLHKGLALGNLYNQEEMYFKYSTRIKNIMARGIKFNLNFLVKTYNVENLRDSGIHGAIEDTTMTFHIFNKMKEKYYL